MFVFSLGACATIACRERLNIKIWFLDAPTASLVRQQDNERMSCADDAADAYRCLSPGDFEVLMNYCDTNRRTLGEF